ncbi:phosphodiester glycosidase family protein [Thalassovita sp.]|uniref:phosphodiester glycosidase family protein n=1 Tax=Thalassovita sp. TaxID=1979401 RepID=UPI002B275D1A|nr:phosphodiester glycosidase family protein [Thalassovita sp.]
MITARVFPALSVALSLFGSVVGAVDCQNVNFDGHSYTICEADPAREELRLFLRDDEGQILGMFNRVEAALEQNDETLLFAMNAGMYHPDRQPVGHYLENGVQQQAVIEGASPGNFGLLPNGVFCIGSKVARVYETYRYLTDHPDCLFATQSGPMLVIDGALHARFLIDSTSRYIRNGVGTTDSGDRAVFAISNERVTFHEFGRLFRDGLKLPQALYFDGKVSRIYAPTLQRNDPGLPLGPIVGIVAPRQAE